MTKAPQSNGFLRADLEADDLRQMAPYQGDQPATPGPSDTDKVTTAIVDDAPVLASPTSPQRAPVRVLHEDEVEWTATNRILRARPRGTGYLPFRYSIAGIVTVGSEVRLPELEFFRMPWLGREYDIEVRVGKVGQSFPRGRARLFRFYGPSGVRYEEHLGRLGANFAIDMKERIHVTLSPLLARSPHVAYTNILEALLRYMVASQGAMLLHSACVEINGVGVMLSAKTDTGKTGTVLRLLREHGAKFLSDDMTILWPDGRAEAFPKPMTISAHTLRAVDPGDLSKTAWWLLGLQGRLHSKSGRSVGMAMGDQNLPIMTANALTQLFVPPPKYYADRLVACDVIPRTNVSEMFIIERGAPALQDVPDGQAVEELVENTDDAYGFPPYRYLAPVLEVRGESYESLQRRERAVLKAAMSSVRVRRLASDCFGWADELPRLIAGSGNGA